MVYRCLQHPYLVSDTIEPRDLPPQETHDRLIGASAKLRLLKVLLPKLRDRGHRVLLFSQVRRIFPHFQPVQLTRFQFVIALDIVEDFLIGEGVKYLRLVSTCLGKKICLTHQFMLAFRMGIRNSRNGRRAWTSLTSLTQMSLYISSQHALVVLASTFTAQTQ